MAAERAVPSVDTNHPAADLFPLMPADELGELAADVERRGLLHPIVLDEDGLVLDGRNRLAACEQVGIEPEFVTYDGDDPFGYVISANVRRRHLSREQKRDLIAAVLLREPDRSDRQVAKDVGASPSTVGAVRDGLEATDQLGQLEQRTGADGKSRRPRTDVVGQIEQVLMHARRAVQAAEPLERSHFTSRKDEAARWADGLRTHVQALQRLLDTLSEASQ